MSLNTWNLVLNIIIEQLFNNIFTCVMSKVFAICIPQSSNIVISSTTTKSKLVKLWSGIIHCSLTHCNCSLVSLPHPQNLLSGIYSKKAHPLACLFVSCPPPRLLELVPFSQLFPSKLLTIIFKLFLKFTVPLYLWHPLLSIYWFTFPTSASAFLLLTGTYLSQISKVAILSLCR